MRQASFFSFTWHRVAAISLERSPSAKDNDGRHFAQRHDLQWVPTWIHLYATWTALIWSLSRAGFQPYRKSKVHPSLAVLSDHLVFLPATLLTLTVAFLEVLAYLISCIDNSSDGSRNGQKQKTVAGSGSGGDHPASFNCNCFRCYMSYWVQRDSSPNRQIIPEILDGFEDRLIQQRANSKSKKERRRRGTHADSSQVGMLCTSHSQGHRLQL
ncbi:hypothetical protein NE237_004092 [Protea cynaroides]|uniref:Uncharacterized protein n=1 Tax=Protea cynaroides TaxID=273540 RepID=A0A9Q0QT76_9MAGN|nr:hypothetical protein NE237_004092 [Protea cynaroides]